MSGCKAPAHRPTLLRQPTPGTDLVAGEAAEEASLDGDEVRRVRMMVREHIGAVRDVVQVVFMAVACPHHRCVRGGEGGQKERGKGTCVTYAQPIYRVNNHPQNSKVPRMRDRTAVLRGVAAVLLEELDDVRLAVRHLLLDLVLNLWLKQCGRRRRRWGALFFSGEGA